MSAYYYWIGLVISGTERVPLILVLLELIQLSVLPLNFLRILLLGTLYKEYKLINIIRLFHCFFCNISLKIQSIRAAITTTHRSLLTRKLDWNWQENLKTDLKNWNEYQSRPHYGSMYGEITFSKKL